MFKSVDYFSSSAWEHSSVSFHLLGERSTYEYIFMTYKCVFLGEAGVTHNIYSEIWMSFFTPGWLFKLFTTVSDAWLVG